MNRIKMAGICVLVSSFALSGCVARTYNLTRDRLDQDLSTSSGNRGYLMGTAPEPKERSSTRTVRIFEVELGKNKKSTASCPSSTPLSTDTSEPAMSTDYDFPVQNEQAQAGFEKYTVGKNDTLQKISKKFYGTTKKWPKIYEANKDVLRTPDRVYPGQVLNIPSAGAKSELAQMEEPKENLK